MRYATVQLSGTQFDWVKTKVRQVEGTTFRCLGAADSLCRMHLFTKSDCGIFPQGHTCILMISRGAQFGLKMKSHSVIIF